jgi:hypothetical protein
VCVFLVLFEENIIVGCTLHNAYYNSMILCLFYPMLKLAMAYISPVKCRARSQGGGINHGQCVGNPGRSLPLIFCIHVRSGPIHWGGYLPCKKDYKVMVFYVKSLKILYVMVFYM